MSEAEIMKRVCDLFARRGYATARELPFFERRLDLVAVDPKSSRVTVVEGKVKNWQRGVAQIVLAQTCAHASFLAVAKEYAPRVPRDVLREWSIGLITVDGEAHIETDAPRLKCTNRYCVRMVREAMRIEGKCYACR